MTTYTNIFVYNENGTLIDNFQTDDLSSFEEVQKFVEKIHPQIAHNRIKTTKTTDKTDNYIPNTTQETTPMENATTAQITAVYNEIADKPVKKFKDKATAIARTAQLLHESNLMVDYNEEGNLEIFEMGIVDETEDHSPSEEAKAPSVRKARTEFTDDLVISTNREDNPKRAKSKAHARFALYATSPTVGDYLDAARKLEDNTKPRHHYLRDIHWDVKHGFISVS